MGRGRGEDGAVREGGPGGHNSVQKSLHVHCIMQAHLILVPLFELNLPDSKNHLEDTC